MLHFGCWIGIYLSESTYTVFGVLESPSNQQVLYVPQFSYFCAEVVKLQFQAVKLSALLFRVRRFSRFQPQVSICYNVKPHCSNCLNPMLFSRATGQLVRGVLGFMHMYLLTMIGSTATLRSNVWATTLSCLVITDYRSHLTYGTYYAISVMITRTAISGLTLFRYRQDRMWCLDGLY